MPVERLIKIIAHIRSDFPSKFGIPRQSGLADALRATVVFEPEYRNADALRGLEGFSHIWLIWENRSFETKSLHLDHIPISRLTYWCHRSLSLRNPYRLLQKQWHLFVQYQER